MTTPILVSGPDYLRLSTDDVLYMISAGLIVSGLTSFIQVRDRLSVCALAAAELRFFLACCSSAAFENDSQCQVRVSE